MGAALDALLDEHPVAVLHDRRMPRSRANIDHLALAPGGVFTIDAKHYEGRLQVRARGGELWIPGRNRSKLLEQARRQTGAVQQVLSAAGLEDVPVAPVAVLRRDADVTLFPPSRAGGVLLTTPRKLPTILMEGEGAIDTQLRSRITDALERALPPADPGSQGSKRAAKDATAEERAAASAPPRADDRSSSSPPACERCGETMVVRRRRSDGARFLGCSAFPRCRNTLPLPDLT